MSKLSELTSVAVNSPREVLDKVRRKVVWAVERSGHAHRIPMRATTRSKVFAAAYESRAWGSDECGSGTGSELRATAQVRAELRAVLRWYEVKSLMDAPCGDWNWMRHVDLRGFEYHGVDIVGSVVARNTAAHARPGVDFRVADMTRDILPSVDAILCRSCLVHLSYRDIAAILANFKSTGATWLLLNTYPEVTENRDQFSGVSRRRLNFERAPFDFPPPVETIADGSPADASQLAMWRLADLPDLIF